MSDISTLHWTTHPPLPLPRKRHGNALLVACGVFFLLLAGQYLWKIQHGPTRSAFLRWGNQIQDLCQGIDIWQVHEYPSPPIMALVLIPFSCLPELSGAMSWFALKALLTLLAIRWVGRMLDAAEGLPDASRPLPVWARLAGLLLVLGPVEGDLTHGNVNLFILFLLTAGLYSFVRGRDFLAGLLVGASIACKLTPLLFVPYFLWKRAWKTLAGCGLSVLLLWGVVPGFAFGFEANARFLASWVEKMVVPYVIDGKVTSEHQNQSLPGLAHRLLTHSPAVSERVGTEYFPREYHNFVDLDAGIVRMMLLATMAGFVALAVWTCRTPLSNRRDWRLCAEFSVVIIGMLLFSERTWKQHCVVLLLPGALMGMCLARLEKARARLLWGVVAACLLLFCAASGLVPGRARLGDLAQVYGCYTWALLLLLAASCILLASRERKRPEYARELFWLASEINSASDPP